MFPLHFHPSNQHVEPSPSGELARAFINPSISLRTRQYSPSDLICGMCTVESSSNMAGPSYHNRSKLTSIRFVAHLSGGRNSWIYERDLRARRP